MSDEDGPAPTPRYRRMLENSVGVAREMGNSYVGVEHLFLAIIRDRDAVPTQALARLIDLGQLEAGLPGGDSVAQLRRPGAGQRRVVPEQ